MPTVPDSNVPVFDDFYLASRRRLVLSAYALTGDLSATRAAVREAFVTARHRWRKVGRLPDPEEWVRPRAWAMAQRRHVARLWHRERGIGAEQKEVLDALHHLPDQQRKVLLLATISALSTEDIGRELGETPQRVIELRAAATTSFCQETGTPDSEVGAAVERLAPIAEAAALPGPASIDRDGRRRHRVSTLAGSVVLLVLTVLGGLFVLDGGEPPARAATASADRPVTTAMLLTPAQVQPLAPGERWRLLGTTDNTTGTGINTVCQDTRFADPRGRGTMVRKFATAAARGSGGTRGSGGIRRTLLQTVEISRSPAAAARAYRTTLGWFAGCRQARLQLLNTYRVRGLGEEAQLLKLRIPNAVRRTYVVGLVRTGSLTVSTVSETLGGRPVRVQRAVDTLTTAVRDLCHADSSGPCPVRVLTAPVLPPPSGESPGTLAAADLPVIGRINRPWVGTRPVVAKPNLAATTCDKANFRRAGAPRATMRTFLIPQARLPRRFGITETVGRFARPRAAHRFVRHVSAAMAACEKKDLGATVSSEVAQRHGYRGSEFALWRLDSEIDKHTTVGFWMGVARVGRYVAQVNFTPTGHNDVDEDTFQALISRARDRLFELTGSTR